MSGRLDSALEEAAEWYFRQDGRALSDTERARFDAWLVVPENKAAYEEIAGVWRETGALATPSRRRHPKWVAVARIAAAVVLVCGISAYVFDVPTRFGADIYTEAGEHRSVALQDGSIAEVNTASAVAIDFSDEERRVSLLKGEALFTVAKDPARPFVVEAGGYEVTALGTVFAVRETGEDTVVTVLESAVSVSSADGSSATRLGPGEQVRARAGGYEITRVDVAAAIAWRQGKLVFSDKPLGSVIADIDRYHSGFVRIIDPALRDLRVSGVFDATDPVGAVDALEDSLGIVSTRLGSAIVLLHR